MADLTREELQQMLTDILRPTGNSSGQDPDGKTKNGQGTTLDLGPLADKMSALSGQIEKLAGVVGLNTDALKQAPAAYMGYKSTDDTSKAFQIAANMLGDRIGGFVNKLEQIRINAQAANNSGIGQGDYLQQRADFQAAGYKTFQDGLKAVTDDKGNFKNSLSGFGHSADDATKKFNNFSEELGNSPAIRNLINKNIISPTDVPKLAMIAAQGKTDMLEPENRAKLVAEMARQAVILNQMSSAYGINRQALMDNAIANNENTESQIRQQAVGDDNARRQMQVNRAIATPAGASMQDLVDKLASGARLSKEDRALLGVGTMGMSGELVSAVKETQRTKSLDINNPQRIAAEERLADVLANIRARQASPEAARLAQSMKDGTNKSVLTKTMAESKQFRDMEQKIIKEQGVTPAEARKIAQQNLGGANARGELQQGSGANPPVANTGAKVSETLAEVNFAYTKNAAAASAAIADLNKKLGESTVLFRGVKELLTLPVGGAQESTAQKKQNIDKLVKPLTDLVFEPPKANALPSNSRLNEDGSLKPTGTVNMPNGNLTVTNPTNVTVNGPGNNVPSRLNPDGTLKPAATETRGTGTLGETGFPTEMKDVVAKLHKGETVLTPDQLKNLISGTGMLTASDTVSSMISSLTGGTKSTSAPTGGFDISKIFDSVNTSISSSSKADLTPDLIYSGMSKALKEATVDKKETTPAKEDPKKTGIVVPATNKTDSIIEKMMSKFNTTVTSITGGGTTTTKRVQNEDSKNAEAQLESLKAQYAKDRANIGSQLKESMGPDTKGMDVIRALKDNPEAKVLEEKMKSAEALLSKRIDLGTTINQTKESGIQPNQIVEKMSPAISITDAFRDFNTETAEEPVIEANEEPMMFEEESDTISLKDLNEQLIQLNTGIRQLIDHSANVVEQTGVQIKATRSLSGNRFA